MISKPEPDENTLQADQRMNPDLTASKKISERQQGAGGRKPADEAGLRGQHIGANPPKQHEDGKAGETGCKMQQPAQAVQCPLALLRPAGRRPDRSGMFDDSIHAS
ncbi:hypothetical protein [Georhizobium sp. MAB10]|uniref:hypothetical protein n=1 Tax=Georhizobium sp. MAB10 TaxID=3028319 RepID=UPI003855CFE3